MFICRISRLDLFYRRILLYQILLLKNIYICLLFITGLESNKDSSKFIKYLLYWIL